MLASVVYRTEPLTAADYDEAIEALRLGRSQLAADPRGCIVCESDDHSAPDCHHNPLVLARRFAAVIHVLELIPSPLPYPEDVVRAPLGWRCFHCDERFVSEADAREHFGKSEDEVARCLVRAATDTEGSKP